MQNDRPPSTQGQNAVDVKLPLLELPTFRGNATEWPAFVDLFNASIGKNPHLSPSQKLQYLKTAMKGEASNVLKHLPTTDAAYEEAWSLLKNRFENCREIINGHLERLLHHEKVTGTPSSIRSLLDSTNECRNALKIFNQSIEDAILNFIVWEKLDQETRRSWELSLHDDKIPKHTEMINFLELRARALKTDEQHNTKSTSYNVPKVLTKKCPACEGNHFAYVCEQFKKSSLQEREALVRSAKLCFTCLKSNHSSRACTADGCRKCKKRHHTFLHGGNINSASSNHSYCQKKLASPQRALLATAVIKVKNSEGKFHKVRCLLDMGSTVSFITQELANTLNLPRMNTTLCWSGVGGKGSGKTTSSVKITGLSLVEDFTFTTQAFVTRQITGCQPSTTFSPHTWNHIKNLKLADQEFFKAGPIDVLLGVDILSTILQENLKRGSAEMPVAQRTKLGWVLFGPLSENYEETAKVLCAYPTLEHQAQRFWEVENIEETQRKLTMEEQDRENFFQRTVSREQDGSYSVRLPFKENNSPSSNKGVAFRRFLALERRFQRDDKLRKEYVAAIDDFKQRGHLIPVPFSEKEAPSVAYLPHHPVINWNKDTTKVRVVFDASARSKNETSLNDVLLNGPKLQDDLFDLLLRFRRYAVVFTADIEKMYRQVHIHPSDFNFQRIFWRENGQQPIQEFCLTTVTFGVKPAPYLATRVLQQLAEDEAENFPQASAILKGDFYVDDLLSGSNSVQEAQNVCKQLDQLLRAGGFTLRKWASNLPETLTKIPKERRASAETKFSIDDNEFVKTLGLIWNPGADYFSFKVTALTTGKSTKRTVLSDICRTFDPLGWLSPFTIRGKIIFQGLWKETLSWDDPIPPQALQQWMEYKKEAQEISEIRVPRRITAPIAEKSVLCGFADASQQAYSAVVY